MALSGDGAWLIVFGIDFPRALCAHGEFTQLRETVELSCGPWMRRPKQAHALQPPGKTLLTNA